MQSSSLLLRGKCKKYEVLEELFKIANYSLPTTHSLLVISAIYVLHVTPIA